MIGRGYESRDLAAGSSRNASPTNHPDHPPPPPSAAALRPIPCILRLPPSSSCARPSTPRNTVLASAVSYPTLHFSSTLRTLHLSRSSSPPPGTATELVRLPPPPRFCTLHRADTLGVLNGIVATLLLATSKCRRRRLRLRRRRRQRSLAHALSPSHSLLLSPSFSLVIFSSLIARVSFSDEPTFRRMEMLCSRWNILASRDFLRLMMLDDWIRIGIIRVN